MEFPLYDELVKRSESNAAPPTDIWKYMMNLPPEPTEVVFALIWHHASLHNALPTQVKTAKRFILPYQGKLFEGGKGAVFRIDDLPIDLKTLIAIYVNGVVRV
jgi:hypothetical protein